MRAFLRTLRPRITRTLLVLLFSSALGVGLVVVRVMLSRRWQHMYLVGNLFLAWIPLTITLVLDFWDNFPSVRAWRRSGACIAWFLFFPNAPYILTDLVHLGPKQYGHFWVDMLLILLFVINGLVLGFLSLQSMQRRVERRTNWAAGWLFVAGMSLLSGMGIYAGRFLRWNSWDVVARPGLLAGDIEEWFTNPFDHPLSIVFPLLFGVVLFTFYLTLWAVASDDGARPSIATDRSMRFFDAPGQTVE